jgi:threonine/homoserine/homoserine lactone efflux protein
VSLTAFAVRGLAVGFVIAAAIGPVGLLCIRRTLTGGRAAGLATGLGAATADALYASIAAFGLSAAADLLVSERRALALAGGVLLVGVAARGWVRRHAPARATVPGRTGAPGTLLGAWATTVALTITNPATILSFVAAFAGFGLVTGGGLEAAALVAGVFAGSAAWWVVLVGASDVLRPRLGPVGLARLSGVSAVLIGGMGALAILGGALQG